MPEFPHLEFLFTVAEVAAAFVGFSLVVSAFKPATASDALRMGSLRDVAEIGLSAIAAAFSPYLLHSFGFGVEAAWRLASLSFAIGGIVAFSLGFRRFSKLGGAPPWQTAPALSVAAGTLSILGSISLWWNVFAPSGFSGARYVLALLLLLAMAGLIFVFAAFNREESTGT